MKQAALALQAIVARLFASVGLEGAFLLAGTALLAIGSGYLSPAGPLFVIGAMCVLAGLALAVPQRKA